MTSLYRKRRELFAPTPEGEARLLLLIHAFSSKPEGVEGRLKLAKLDFLLRYPDFFNRAMAKRVPGKALPNLESGAVPTVEESMIRYRFGPWDPAHFALIGRLVSRGLVVPVHNKHGIGLRTTDRARAIVENLSQSPEWSDDAKRATLLNEHFDLAGQTLMKFLYKTFPEILETPMGGKL